MLSKDSARYILPNNTCKMICRKLGQVVSDYDAAGEQADVELVHSFEILGFVLDSRCTGSTGHAMNCDGSS